MSRFFVDLDALGLASRRITGVLAELGAQLETALSCDPMSFGHDRLTGAVKGFCESRQQGIKSLAQDSQQIADQLVHTADTYRQADVSSYDALTVVEASDGG